MPYTEQFSEVHALLDKMVVSGGVAGANSGYNSLAKYHRAVIIIVPLSIASTFNVDIEVAEDAAGTHAHTLKSITQMTAADNGGVVQIEIRGEELANPTGASGSNYDFINVEVTPAGGAATYVVLLYGIEPRYAEVDQSLLTEVVA